MILNHVNKTQKMGKKGILRSQWYLTLTGGLLFLRSGANTQYACAAALLFSIYSDVLAKHNEKVTCGNKQFGPSDLMAFAKGQVCTSFK